MSGVRSISTGVCLATLEAGEGGRPLLLVHGFTGAKEDFADWIGPFAAAGWWVVAPDLRGHGSSDQPDEEGSYSIGVLADDALALAADLGWERFALLGHSMGGMVAQEIVLRDGHPVDRLVLMDTCHGAVEGLDPAVVEIGLDVVRSQGLPALVALIASLPARAKAPSEVRVRAEREGYAEFADGKVHRCSAAMYAAIGWELANRADRLGELSALDLPTCVVVGADDEHFVGPSKRMADAISGAQLTVVPDAAHSPQFEAPDAWWSAVSTFLAG